MTATPLHRRAVRGTRLVARISHADKEVIARAAALKGESLGNFVVAQAREAATKLVEEQNVIRLNAEETRRLLDALLHPPAPNAALRKAVKRYRETIISDMNPSLRPKR